MGQRVFRNGHPVFFTGHYLSSAAHGSDFPVPSLNGPDETVSQAWEASCSPYPGYCAGQSECEFRDYCNHLYYSDGRCDCMLVWRKTTGLVLPASA